MVSLPLEKTSVGVSSAARRMAGHCGIPASILRLLPAGHTNAYPCWLGFRRAGEFADLAAGFLFTQPAPVMDLAAGPRLDT